jgi:hypothetical protein
LNRTFPIISVAAPVPAWLAFLNGEMGEAAFREVLEIHEDGLRGGGGLAPPDPERRNPSRWRTDAAVRPLFEFQLGVADDPFEYSLHLAPELTASPFAGGLITLQGGIRLHDDLDPCGSEDPCGSWVKPVRNTLSWGGWLPGRVLLAASAGTFPGDRYGFAGEAGRLFWDGQIEVWAGGDLSGELQFLEDLIEYSSPEQCSAFLPATHRTPAIDVESTVQVGRFREEKEAVRVEVARRFHEFELAFFGIANEDDTVAGVHIKLPLPLTRYLKPAPFRLTTVPEFPFTYRDSRQAIGVQIPLFDNMDRLRKRLYPTFIRNNLEDLRRARREIEESRG